MEGRDYSAIARQYAGDVTKGSVSACKSIRLQCQRFLDELKAQKGKAFPYRFDEAKAARVCKFIERLPHSKGKWARSGTIRLEPWQVWILCCAFGWLHKAGNRAGTRRFRVLFIVVPRKNGKSALSAGIGLYMLCADGEYGAEVYSGATNEKQAWEVFKPAQLMAKRTPALLRHFGLEVNAKSLVKVADSSKFETIVGDPGDGQSPSCSIHDEYHEHPDDGQVNTMQTGMGAREHGGCPVMEWEMNNVVAQADAKDNVYPRKPRDEAKIDNPVALIAALAVAMTKEEEEMPTSPWDDPEFSMAGADE